MVDALQVQQLEEDLLEDVQDDWVSVMAMVWSAQHVLHLTDLDEIENVITETLVQLLAHPSVKVLDGDMVKVFMEPEDLRSHIRRHWPRSGSIPVSGDVAWLVQRDFVVAPVDGG